MTNAERQKRHRARVHWRQQSGLNRARRNTANGTYQPIEPGDMVAVSLHDLIGLGTPDE
jgi:hypothetical protein